MTHEDAERSQRAVYGVPPIWDPGHQTWSAPGGEVPAAHYQGPGWGAYGGQQAPMPSQPYAESLGGVGDDKPPKRRRRWPWVTAVVALLVFGLAALLGGNSNPDGGPALREGVPTPPASAPAQPQETAPAARWTTVAQLKGTAYETGSTFALGSGRYRLVYDATDVQNKDLNMIAFAAYIMPKGTVFETDGGVPVSGVLTEPGRDVVEIQKPAGQYYLYVIASNVDWSVTLQGLK